MSKPKKKKTAPKINLRLLARPRLDALFERHARSELDDDGLHAAVQALIAELGPRPVLDGLVKRLESTPPAEREAFLAGASRWRGPDVTAALWQQARNAGLSKEARVVCLALLEAMGEDADPDHPERFLPKPLKPARGTAPVPTFPPPPPLPPRTPEAEAADERWEAFEAADLPGKIALFDSTLAAGEMDDDEAFEMLNEIRGKLNLSENPAARSQYAALVERLRSAAPALYAKSRAYYLENLINDAASEGRWEALPALIAELGPTAASDADTFARVIDLLMYHGQARPLLDAMRAAWPAVSRSGEIMPWGINEFQGQLLKLIFFEYVETAAAPRADDPALREAAAPYGEFNPDWIERAVHHLTTPTPWTPADFGPAADAEQWEHNLQGLLWEFMAEQGRAGVPLSRVELARPEWTRVLHEQMTTSAPAKPKGKAGKKTVAPLRSRASGHPLVPDKEALNRSGGDLLHFLNMQLYKLGATFELLPAYLHFIARRGLLARGDFESALDRLRPLAGNVQTLLERSSQDSRLRDEVSAAWASERLAGLVRDPALPETVAAPPPPPPLPEAKPGKRLTYTFKVSYDRDPEIWRTVELTSTQTLGELHTIIQGAFDFDFDHLYSFFMSGRAWDEASEYAARPDAGERGVSVPIGQLGLRPRQKFLYLFDYGDEHRFTVQLAGVNPDAPKGGYPRLLETHGKSPPQYPSWEDEDEDFEDDKPGDDDLDEGDAWDEGA